MNIPIFIIPEQNLASRIKKRRLCSQILVAVVFIIFSRYDIYNYKKGLFAPKS